MRDACVPFSTTAPFSKHGDEVAVLHGAEPVRDDDAGPADHDPVQRLLHHLLRLAVQRARRLVQQQHRRVLQYRPRDRDPLLLAARQLHPPVAARRLVPVLEVADEVVRVRRPGRALHLRLRRRLRPVDDVLPYRPGEERRLLPHQPHLPPQPPQLVRPHVPPVHLHAALQRVVEPLHQPDDRRLAGPALPHQRRRLPCYGESLEDHHVGARRVREVDPVEVDVASQPLRLVAVGVLRLDLGGAVEDCEDRGHRVGALGEVRRHAAGVGDDAAGADEYHEGLDQLLEGDVALPDELAAVPEVEGPGAGGEAHGGGEAEAGEPGLPAALAGGALLGGVEEAEDAALRGEGGDGAEVGHGLGGQLAALGLRLDGLLGHALEEDAAEVEAHDDHRLHRDHHHRQPPRNDQAHRERYGHGRDGLDHQRHAITHHVFVNIVLNFAAEHKSMHGGTRIQNLFTPGTYHVGVLGQLSGNSAGGVLVLVKPPHLEGQNLGQHPLPHPLGEILPHGAEAVVLPHVDRERRHRQPHEHQRVRPDLRLDLAVVGVEVHRHHAPHRERSTAQTLPRTACFHSGAFIISSRRNDGTGGLAGCAEGSSSSSALPPADRAELVLLESRLLRLLLANREERDAKAEDGPTTSVRCSANEGRVEATVVGDEFVVGTKLFDIAGLHDSDEVGIADSGEAVGDDESGSADGGSVERFLDDALRLGVQRTRRLVEEEDL
ncbi:hypothetical protein ACMD2_21959, partial [Ananas comosus]